jgi:NitT/TauT family transport system permease protein
LPLAPLFLLWFGLGIGSKIALTFSLTFFIVAGLHRGRRARRRPGPHHAGADARRRPGADLSQGSLISAVPTLFSGLRLGLVYALLGVIGGEIIAAQHGLGQYLSYLAGTFQTNGVFAVLLLLGLIGAVLMRLMGLVEARLLRWR